LDRKSPTLETPIYGRKPELLTAHPGPLLQSHGDADELIPIELGRKLFDAAPGSKQFVVLPGGGHNDPQTEEYRQAFDEFIASLPVSTDRSWD
jgi:uncharacterized protein